MRKPKSFLRVFTDTGPLVALAVAIALLIGIVGPASAQFFNFGSGPPRPAAAQRRRLVRRRFLRAIPAAARQQAPRQDFSRAPGPPSATPCRSVTCWCWATRMADWLGYGLEDAYAEQPDMGVIRKHKTVSGLIKYQPRGEPADWAAAAKGILATEKPDAIVVMLGLHDRVRDPRGVRREEERQERRQEGRARQAGRRKAQARKLDVLPRPMPARLTEPKADAAEG